MNIVIWRIFRGNLQFDDFTLRASRNLDQQDRRICNYKVEKIFVVYGQPRMKYLDEFDPWIWPNNVHHYLFGNNGNL